MRLEKRASELFAREVVFVVFFLIFKQSPLKMSNSNEKKMFVLVCGRGGRAVFVRCIFLPTYSFSLRPTKIARKVKHIENS